MPYLKLLDVYGDASALVVVDGSQVSFGELSPPYSEVVYATLTFKDPGQRWEIWGWDAQGLEPEAATAAATQLAIIKNDPSSMRIYETALCEFGFGHDFTEPPIGVDYRRGLDSRLQRELATVNKGEVQLVKYWATATLGAGNVISYADLVLSETYTYARDSYGFALSRTLVIEWYDLDGNASPTTKTMSKTYEATTGRREEGKRKRRLNTDIIEMSTIGGMYSQALNDATSILYGMTYDQVVDRGKELLSQYSGEKSQYVDEDTSAYADGINTHDIVADPDSGWLDEDMPGQAGTFRAYIVGELS